MTSFSPGRLEAFVKYGRLRYEIKQGLLKADIQNPSDGKKSLFSFEEAMKCAWLNHFDRQLCNLDDAAKVTHFVLDLMPNVIADHKENGRRWWLIRENTNVFRLGVSVDKGGLGMEPEEIGNLMDHTLCSNSDFYDLFEVKIWMKKPDWAREGSKMSGMGMQQNTKPKVEIPKIKKPSPILGYHLSQISLTDILYHFQKFCYDLGVDHEHVQVERDDSVNLFNAEVWLRR